MNNIDAELSNVVHVKECECYLQGFFDLLSSVPPCREFDNRDLSDGRNIPTDAQVADAAKILAQARAARRAVGRKLSRYVASRCPRCWWPMHSASVPCR